MMILEGWICHLDLLFLPRMMVAKAANRPVTQLVASDGHFLAPAFGVAGLPTTEGGFGMIQNHVDLLSGKVQWCMHFSTAT